MSSVFISGTTGKKKNREEMYHTSRLKTAEVRALSWRIDGVEEIDTGLFFGK